MSLNEFIADLEARAALVEEPAPLESADFCSHCGKPLHKYREIVRRIGAREYCQVCADMREVVTGREYWAELQKDYEERRKRLNLMRPGSDYFEGRG